MRGKVIAPVLHPWMGLTGLTTVIIFRHQMNARVVAVCNATSGWNCWLGSNAELVRYFGWRRTDCGSGLLLPGNLAKLSLPLPVRCVEALRCRK